jgi:hypothetical protein
MNSSSASTEQVENNAAPLVSVAQQSSSSPEAAGVVRGALRSIRRPSTTSNLFRRGAVGRLPVRRVRKISDSASKGLDLVSNITESIGEGSPKKTFRGFFADWTTKSVVFAKGMWNTVGPFFSRTPLSCQLDKMICSLYSSPPSSFCSIY